MSYAMKTIEAMQLNNVGVTIDELTNKASVENNMIITTSVENLPPKDGIDYGSKVQIITANVKYHIKSNDTGSTKTLTLKTLRVNE